MKRFDVTIRAEATRMISDHIGALEQITSTFIAEGRDALHASDSIVADFKCRYTRRSIDGNLVGCADLDDLEIIEILVVPNEEDKR